MTVTKTGAALARLSSQWTASQTVAKSIACQVLRPPRHGIPLLAPGSYDVATKRGACFDVALHNIKGVTVVAIS
jgi:hypothetical protein